MTHLPAHPVANLGCAQPGDSIDPAGQWSHLLHDTRSWTQAHLCNPGSRMSVTKVSAVDSQRKANHSPINWKISFLSCRSKTADQMFLRTCQIIARFWYKKQINYYLRTQVLDSCGKTKRGIQSIFAFHEINPVL